MSIGKCYFIKMAHVLFIWGFLFLFLGKSKESTCEEINKMSHCRRFGALLKKNWILRKRHYILTALELIIPILLVLPLLWLKPKGLDFSSYAHSSKALPSTIFRAVSARERMSHIYIGSSKNVLFHPNDTKTMQFVRNVIDDFLEAKGSGEYLANFPSRFLMPFKVVCLGVETLNLILHAKNKQKCEQFMYRVFRCISQNNMQDAFKVLYISHTF